MLDSINHDLLEQLTFRWNQPYQEITEQTLHFVDKNNESSI